MQFFSWGISTTRNWLEVLRWTKFPLQCFPYGRYKKRTRRLISFIDINSTRRIKLEQSKQNKTAHCDGCFQFVSSDPLSIFLHLLGALESWPYWTPSAGSMISGFQLGFASGKLAGVQREEKEHDWGSYTPDPCQESYRVALSC